MTDLGVLLRALRRQGDLSQRDLAARAGVPASTVARIESGRATDPKFRTVERLVRAAGGVLAMGVAPSTELGQVPTNPNEGYADAAGRYYPAHLDVREVRSPKDWSGAWWAYLDDLPPERWPVKVPAFTYDLSRRHRDVRRERESKSARVTVRLTTPADAPPNAWRFVAEARPGPTEGRASTGEAAPTGQYEAGEGSAGDAELVGQLCAYLQRGPESWQHRAGAPDETGATDETREVVVCDIRVMRGWQGLGVGRRLITALCEQMVRAGVDRATAVVEDSVAGAFLKACGFQYDGARFHRLTLTPSRR
jgi:transcriptional regulator with XRE-family HTH domain/GNAT superfamily N-acetyltransferase